MTNDRDLFGGLCRFCGLQKSCGKYIFSTDAMETGLLTKIKHLFPEEVELINCDTLLPKFICDTCETTVNYFHEFRKGVKLVQQNLQKKLQDISKECEEINVNKSQHVCSVSKKADALNIRFSSEGFISCLHCNAALQRTEIASCGGKQPVCICDKCGFKDKVEMFISKEDSGCPKCAYMKEKELSPDKAADDDKAFGCEVCRKSFASRGHLNRHRLTHYGSKPYACSECGSRFNQRSSLKTHALIHERSNPFACTWCGQQFRHKQTLANHVVSIHGVANGGGHVYECDKCKKRFVQKEKLKRHYRSHSGEKPFKCDLCERTFTQKVNLKTHYKKHESDEHFSELCIAEMRRSSDSNAAELRPGMLSPLDENFGPLGPDVLAKRAQFAIAGVKQDEGYAQLPHSVLNEAEKGKLIQELLSFESMSPETDSLATFSSIVPDEYRADDATLKVNDDSSTVYFNPSSSSYTMYSSNSSLYDLDSVSQCSALPTFSGLN